MSGKFRCNSAEACPFAAAPTIAFRLTLTNATPSQIIRVSLSAPRSMIEAPKPPLRRDERERLRDLFGEPAAGPDAAPYALDPHLQPRPGLFRSSIDVDLPVACTFDFNVAAAKYFHALERGMCRSFFQFSGTMFYRSAEGVDADRSKSAGTKNAPSACPFRSGGK